MIAAGWRGSWDGPVVTVSGRQKATTVSVKCRGRSTMEQQPVLVKNTLEMLSATMRDALGGDAVQKCERWNRGKRIIGRPGRVGAASWVSLTEPQSRVFWDAVCGFSFDFVRSRATACAHG